MLKLELTSVRYQGMSAEAEYSMFNQILKTLKPRDLIYENRSSCKRKKFHKENLCDAGTYYKTTYFRNHF